MNKEEQLQKIIEEQLPAILSDRETIVSVVGKFPKEAAELQPRLEAALWMAQAKSSLEPRPDFIHSSRQYLEQRLATESPRTFWQGLFGRFTPQRWGFSLAAPTLLLAVIALVINSLILSARLSIPGDPLYSTKLAMEDIRVAFTFDSEDRTNLYIQFSRERATEFVELVIEGDYEQLPPAAERLESDIIATLHSLRYLPAQDSVAEKSMNTGLRETLSSEISLLSMLKETSPDSASYGIDLAIQVAQSGVLALH